MKHILLILGTIILYGCTNENIKKKYNYTEGYYEVGNCIVDSLFHGKVDWYTLDNVYGGFSTYKFGSKNGLTISVFPNGKTEDSMFFENNQKNRQAYIFDSLGYLNYVTNYLNGREVGGTEWYYPKGGGLKTYSFTNFEGKNIYNLYNNISDTIENGEILNYSIDTININGKERLHLFLYLIIWPDVKMHYEIVDVLDEKIVSSKKIISDKCYYETDLEMPIGNHKWAIALSIYNKSKGKNDLTVYVLK